MKKRIEIFTSPVHLSATVFVRDEQGVMTSYKVKNKELVSFVSKFDNIDEINIVGAKTYTSRIQNQLESHIKEKNCKFILRSK